MQKSLSLLFNKFVTATAILAMLLAALPALPVAAAGSITVEITSDEYLENSDCSLREAIIAANMNTSFFGCTYTGTGPDDVIILQSGATYALTRVGTTSTQGDLDVALADGSSGDLTIQASGATNAIIDATAVANRVMEVDPAGNTDLTLSHITLTNGNAPFGAGIEFGGDGALTLSYSTVSNNTATSGTDCGAGIFSSGLATIVIDHSTVANNTCTGLNADGGGLLKINGGTVTITNSTFADNATSDNGGGVYLDINTGTATITNSTFFNNAAGDRGGGLQVKTGTVTVAFSTFSGNAASYDGPSMGGAVQATGGSVQISNSILANSVTTGGTQQDCDQLLPGTVSVSNSLVENTIDCTGTIVSSADPMLGSLADNGGSTMTLALLPGSPAINLSNDAGCPATDQRGVTRPQGAHCDLGSYEFADAFPVVNSINRASPNPTNASSVNFTVTFSENVTGVDASDFVLTTTGVTGASITGVSGSNATYTVTVNTGTGDGTIRLDLVDNDSIHDAGGNALGGTGNANGNFSTGEVYTIDKTPTFADVPFTYWAWSYIERLYNAGVTGGCATGPLRYCPLSVVTRDQMAVFLLRGKHGSAYVPPAVGASTGFNDVPPDYWAAAWIKQLAAEGITSGCGNGNYCPTTPVTRDQMAVFLLKAEHGSSYVPPAATGVFTDVPVGYWAASWIERLAAEGITAGCGGSNYCPTTPVSRDQMAVFLVKTFNLP